MAGLDPAIKLPNDILLGGFVRRHIDALPEACRARSRAEFISRVGVVEEEADETAYWPEVLLESAIVEDERITELLKETNEITAMIVASIKTLRART